MKEAAQADPSIVIQAPDHPPHHKSLGSIGKETAKRLEAFVCIISYTSKNKKPLVSYPFYETILELASTMWVLSPHAAVHTNESVMTTSELMAANLEAFFSNKPLLTPVIL
ncbi:hypothetical protein K1719_015924 [Acacia pycnantha]|nr:hypothetical protein K1719_015924 [Acacia pycnantha]